jgi:hypothetical protein
MSELGTQVKYVKGDQKESLDSLSFGKVRLTDGKDTENIWVFLGDGYNVLANDAVAFSFRSWGLIIPVSDVIEVSLIDKDLLELHPDAWEQYIEHGAIDSEGNPLPEAEEE